MCLPDDEIAGNMGLLDQQLAFKWVHEHIYAFGGDPDRVTIMGESAGSASVTYHMLADSSQPYFNQAIAESGSALSSWAFDSTPLQHAQEISGEYLGCPVDSVTNMVYCLKNIKTAEDIVVSHKKYYVKVFKHHSAGLTILFRKMRESRLRWDSEAQFPALRLTEPPSS